MQLLNFFNKFAPTLARSSLPNYAGMLNVKVGRPLVAQGLNLVYLLRGRLTSNYAAVVASFMRDLWLINRKSGKRFVVFYLKACSILLMQAVSKQVVRNNGQLFKAAVARTSTGIPRIIPKAHRMHIRNGSEFHIRFWLSLFSLYRVIECVGLISIKTIISPLPAPISNSFMGEFIESTCDFLRIHRVSELTLPEFQPFIIAKRASCSVKPQELGGSRGPSTHSLSIMAAMLSWLDLTVQFGKLQGSLKVFGIMANFVNSKFAYFIQALRPVMVDLFDAMDLPLGNLDLGRLAFLVEPAAKIRVVAMVDPFTQWLLRPLHLFIFSILRRLVWDATFDQRGKVRKFTDAVRDRGIKEIYSYDLTAATDRLPVDLQAVIISNIFSPDIALAWKSFLVDRWYRVKQHLFDASGTRIDRLQVSEDHPMVQTTTFNYPVGYKKQGNKSPYSHTHVSNIKYAVGQPMGALSSWAMLALMHHIIVHMAGRRANVTDFLYLILGDDVVIADSAVASHYLDILSEIGSPINLTKSIVSTNGSFEFAKRFIVDYVDVTPLSFREMGMALIDIRALLQLVANLPNVRVSTVLSVLGHGYKATSRLTGPFRRMSRSMGRLLLLLSIPGARFSRMTSFTEWLLSYAMNSYRKQLPELLKARHWLLQLMMKLIRGLKYSDVPLSEYGLLSYYKKNLPVNLESHKNSLAFVSHLMWVTFYESLSDQAKMSTMAARGSFTRLAMQAKVTKDEKSILSTLDALFALFKAGEDAISLMSVGDENNWKEISNIIKINRCRELDWADHLRSQFPSLNVSLSSNLRKVRTVHSSQLNVTKRSRV
jgi:hypothetical protein